MAIWYLDLTTVDYFVIAYLLGASLCIIWHGNQTFTRMSKFLSATGPRIIGFGLLMGLYLLWPFTQHKTTKFDKMLLERCRKAFEVDSCMTEQQQRLFRASFGNPYLLMPYEIIERADLVRSVVYIPYGVREVLFKMNVKGYGIPGKDLIERDASMLGEMELIELHQRGKNTYYKLTRRGKLMNTVSKANGFMERQ